MQHILIIGGSGKWGRSIYLPVFSNNREFFKLVAIADLVDPYKEGYSSNFYISLHQHQTRWLRLTGNLDQDLSILDNFLKDDEIDSLIVTTPPLLHYIYINWGIKNGLNIICDKPPIAQSRQFGNSKLEVWNDFNNLCDSLDNSRHRRYGTNCQVYLPLRRRLEYPYTEIYKGLREVFEYTGQHITHISLHLNDGSYRFPDEYDLPGAHGYRDGLGSLTHTGYHLMDLVAKCLKQAPPPSRYIESRIIHCLNVKQARQINSDKGYCQIIGRQQESNDLKSFAGDDSELDIQISYEFKNTPETYSDCEIFLSFIHRGCTKRISAYYSDNCTHDEGRVDDTVLIIHQGALQSFHLLISDDSGGAIPNGHMRFVRRLNPKLAEIVKQKPLILEDTLLFPGMSKQFYQHLVEKLLKVFDIKISNESFMTLSLKEQYIAMKLYSLALNASRGLSRAEWNSN